MFGSLADQIHHTRKVYRNHKRLIDLEKLYDDATDPVNRAAIAERMAFIIEHQIEHLGVSWLARALTSLRVSTLHVDRAVWLTRSEQAWAQAAAARKGQ